MNIKVSPYSPQRAALLSSLLSRCDENTSEKQKADRLIFIHDALLLV
jgi:hypothetical protein